jgi:hypothetical protein
MGVGLWLKAHKITKNTEKASFDKKINSRVHLHVA